ncbi:hypothetical protein ABEX25_04985 [Paenibacillus thiaminolyticus]|uniref:hypothetical protein n=1 Tax=Paenibacillus thiaminolyticus TaxID=49283 RepID=UPI003D287C72
MLNLGKINWLFDGKRTGAAFFERQSTAKGITEDAIDGTLQAIGRVGDETPFQNVLKSAGTIAALSVAVGSESIGCDNSR